MKQYQKVPITILAVFLMFLLCVPYAAAHPGRTDSNGGHYNRSTGEYHYHHGYSAHQHPDGVCPYDYENTETSNPSDFLKETAEESDKWQEQYTSNDSAKEQEELQKDGATDWVTFLGYILFYIPLGALILSSIIYFLLVIILQFFRLESTKEDKVLSCAFKLCMILFVVIGIAYYIWIWFF